MKTLVDQSVVENMLSNVKMPDSQGYFGDFGGRFVPEQLEPIMQEIEEGILCY